VQSGSTITLGQGQRSGARVERLLAELGVAKDKLEDLQKVPWNKILEAQANQGFGPVVDGEVIPRHPFEPDAPVVSAEVPLIVGYTREDAAIRNLNASTLNEEALKQWAQETYGENGATRLAAYRRVYPTATPYQVQSRMRTDANTGRRATTMAERKAAQGRGKAYLYVMAWPSPAFEGRFGATHGVDLGLILANPRNPIAGNTPEARRLAELVGSAMVAFAKTGDPNCDKLPRWPAYDAQTRATMIFDADSRVENDPTKELRPLWEA
jgi:para-nitrobenzyl esterase